jgi:hypothetical protein
VFTSDHARKAKIQLGDYPADKLVARASSRLCRRVFPDVLAGPRSSTNSRTATMSATAARDPRLCSGSASRAQ